MYTTTASDFCMCIGFVDGCVDLIVQNWHSESIGNKVVTIIA
jgi:hypothetical protein